MSKFTEADLRAMVQRSFQFGEDDMSLLLDGMALANKSIRTREEFADNKDKLVEGRLSTEFTFNCVLKDKDTEDCLMKADEQKEKIIVLNVGAEKTIYTDDFKIDRYTGFQGVYLANHLCKVKKEFEEEGRDLKMITSKQVKARMSTYNSLDCFKPPQVESIVDNDMIAIYKRTYNDFLDSMIGPGDRVLYIEGDFGAAGMRRLGHIADCLYFDKEQARRATANRGMNKTQGTDIYMDYSLKEEWASFVGSYTIVIHNFLFGQIYVDLLNLRERYPMMNLIAIGVNPDKKDLDIYKVQQKKSVLEAYNVDVTAAQRYGMQILYDDEQSCVVYIDHGRYEDRKAYGYDVMIPFVGLHSWIGRRCYQAFNHVAVYITGPLSVCWSNYYEFEGDVITVQKIRNNEIVVQGDVILLAGIPNGNVMLLDSQIIDYEDEGRPYWLRRHLLKKAGVKFKDKEFKVTYMVSQMANFDSLVSPQEFSVLEEMKEKPIQAYIEVRGVGWNPYLAKVVYDDNIRSLVTPYESDQDKEKTMIRVSLEQDGDGFRLVLDMLGDFSLFTSVSYSKECVDDNSQIEERGVLNFDDYVDTSIAAEDQFFF